MKRFSIALLLLCCLSTAYAQMPTNGLVAWFPFNGNANDATGNGNNGTVNGATLTTDRLGASNSAYDFNGTSNNISGVTATFPTGATARTVSTWFTAGGVPGNTYSYTLTGYGSAAQNCGTVFGTLLWNQLTPGVKNVGSWQGCYGSNPDVMTAYNYALNTWYHLVVTYQSGQEKVYVNDSLINTTTIGTINTSNGIFHFGSALVNNGWHLGKMDDIAIYNRALSACEVHKLYDSTHPFTSVPLNVTTGVGSNAQFAAHASGAALYQWQTDNGTGFTNLSNAGPYSGINTDTLRINSITAAMNNYLYRCVLSYTSRSCNDTSAAAVLKVVAAGIATAQEARVSIYPNPFAKELNITLAGTTAHPASIRLLDVSGRVVRSGTAEKVLGTTSTYRVAGEELAPGFYTIHLYDGDALIATAKVIKQ